MEDYRIPPARDVLCSVAGARGEDQDALEHLFFRQLRMPNGTFKTTSRGRLHRLDEAIADCLDGSGHTELLDVGAASAVTTLDLLEYLRGRGLNASATALDRWLTGRIYSVPGMDVLTTSGRRSLQVRAGSRVRMRASGEDSLRGAGLNALLQGVATVVGLIDRSPTEVDLTSLRVRESDVSLVEWDLLELNPAWGERFTLVRAANVLNLAYFTETQLADMILMLLSYLKMGGMLVLARTSESGDQVNGTLYEKTGEGLAKRRAELGDGSEVGHLVPVSDP